MGKLNRREFVGTGLVAAAGMGLGWQRSVWSQSTGANETIRLAVVGIRGQGNGHIKAFEKLKHVQVVALCEPDRKILEDRVNEFAGRAEERASRHGGSTNKTVEGYTDLRQVLDRDDIDAVVIATPNHWHALATIWACQAGKHVYVEKPVSHSIWEGRKMVEAARKYNCLVQAGTQQRSCPAIFEAAEDIQSGKYGKVNWVHCYKLNARGSIGKVTEPQPVPNHIDYNLWAGPAPMSPVMRKQFHYDWHWQYSWGDGEMGNWGPHYVDDLRNLLGWKRVPDSIISAGNRFAWDDNGNTPNMHFALMHYEGLPVVVDIRNLPDPQRPAPKRAGGKSGAVYLGARGGNYIHCEGGFIRLARGGGSAYDHDGKRVKQYRGDGGAAHRQNFIDALRSGKRSDLNCDIEEGHLSSAMCHLGNVGYRLGATASVEQIRESMKQHDDAINTLQDMLEQLEGNQVDLKKNPFTLGPKLTFDPSQEQFIGAHAPQANAYLKPSYRKGFEITDRV